jgi:carboxymethylenebutenolidase
MQFPGVQARTIAALGVVVCLRMAMSATISPARVQETFTENGKQIHVETYAPAGSGRHPAVLLLHGSDGIEAHAASYHRSAEQLASQGYVALLVHYFDATGTRWADRDAIARDFLEWMNTVATAVTFAEAKSNVEPHSIGLVGFSLGASVALSLASQDDRIQAVAEFYGTMPELAAAFARRMPPVLILHGAADRIVPVREAHNLEELLKTKGAPYDMKIYPGQGHGFSGEAAGDAASRTIAFFHRYLKP